MIKKIMNESKVIAVELDDDSEPVLTPEVEQERRIAIDDLLQENKFKVVGTIDEQLSRGPYKLKLTIKERRLFLVVTNKKDILIRELNLSLLPFRQVIKDYFEICASYYDAVKRLAPSQIETIDMGRKGIHDEGSRILVERLANKIEMDTLTSRRLFTLICVLHFKV